MTSEFNIALHALFVLDRAEDVVSSQCLASSICTNPARVRKIMAKLRKGKIVGSQSGINGGYYLLDDISDLDLKTICEILETQIICTSWVSGDAKTDNCLVSSGMSRVIKDLYCDLNEKIMEELAKLTIKDMSKKLYE